MALQGSRGSNKNENALTKQLRTLVKELAGTNALLKKINEASKIQQESLQTNRILSEVIGTNSEVFENTIGGFNIALRNQAALFKEGFTETNKFTLELAGSMFITNQSVKALVRMNTKLFSQGQLSEKQIGKLNKSILDTSIQNNIAIGKLVDVINSLDVTFAGVLGVTAEMVEINNKLVKTFGIQVGPQIGKLLSLLTNPAEDIGRLSRVGLFEVARELQAGAATSESIEKALKLLAREFKATAAGGPPSPAIARDILGVLGILASQITNNNKNLTLQQTLSNKLNDSLQGLWKKAIVPLELVALKLLNFSIIGFKFLIKNTLALITIGAIMGGALLPALGAVIASLGVLTGGLTIIGAILGGIAGGFLSFGLDDINKSVGKMSKDLQEMNSRQSRKDQAERFKDIGESSRFAFLSSETLRSAIDRIIFQNNNDVKELVRLARNQLGIAEQQFSLDKSNNGAGGSPTLLLGR